MDIQHDDPTAQQRAEETTPRVPLSVPGAEGVDEKARDDRSPGKPVGHVEGSASELAYRRTDHFEQRRELMQQWADCLLPHGDPA